MNQDSSPITPPPELVQQWFLGARAMPVDQWVTDVATQAARWGADQQLKLDAERINRAWQKGADQELAACCDWIVNRGEPFDELDLHNARRPKPPSLKELALEALNRMDQLPTAQDQQIIRRALEQLND